MTWSPDANRPLLTVYPAGEATKPNVHPQLYTVARSGKHWRHLPLGLGLTSCNVSWR